MKDLKERAIRGGVAKVFAQTANFALRIVSVVVLSRLLDPKDFGVVAMVTAVTGIYGLFTTAGLSSATIQRMTVSDEQVSTLFWINMLIGTALAACCLATAPVLVSFYHEPRLFWITVAVATGFLFNAAGVQHSALLERQLRYFALSQIEIFAQLTSVAVGTGMAIAGLGYWSLVGVAIVPQAVATACFWAVTGWIPGRPRRGIGIRPMLHFGGTITLNGIVMYVAYNLEKVLLGRFWGADALGIYGRAYQLSNIPTENLNSAVGVVAFSALSRLQDDPQRLKSYFLKGYSLVVSMTLPITIFSALWADDIVLVLLGPKWNDAAVIFRLLAPTILIFGMINPLAWLLMSTGLQQRSLRIALVMAPMIIAAYIAGLPYGPQGVAFAYSGVMTLLLVPVVVWALHGTVVSPKDLFLAVSRPLFSGIIAAGCSFAVQLYSGATHVPLLMLVLGGGTMVATYLLMLLFVMGQRRFYVDILVGLKTPSRSGSEE
jgi:O-antigen/teichoic acid export membrane protein